MSVALKAGMLRWSMTVKQLNSVALNTRGHIALASTNSATVATLRASLETLRGSELERVRQQFARATHRIRCWFDSNLTERMWGEIDGLRYNFEQVNDPNHHRRELEIIATVEST